MTVVRFLERPYAVRVVVTGVLRLAWRFGASLPLARHRRVRRAGPTRLPDSYLRHLDNQRPVQILAPALIRLLLHPKMFPMCFGSKPMKSGISQPWKICGFDEITLHRWFRRLSQPALKWRQCMGLTRPAPSCYRRVAKGKRFAVRDGHAH
jgi:hypothetical protein